MGLSWARMGWTRVLISRHIYGGSSVKNSTKPQLMKPPSDRLLRKLKHFNGQDHPLDVEYELMGPTIPGFQTPTHQTNHISPREC